MIDNDAFDAPKFFCCEAHAPVQSDRINPEFGFTVVVFHMHVSQLTSVSSIKKTIDTRQSEELWA